MDSWCLLGEKLPVFFLELKEGILRLKHKRITVLLSHHVCASSLFSPDCTLPTPWFTSIFGVAIRQELSKKHRGGHLVRFMSVSDYIHFSSFIHCFPHMTNALIRYGTLGCKWVSLEPANASVNHALVSRVAVETSGALWSLVLGTRSALPLV